MSYINNKTRLSAAYEDFYKCAIPNLWMAFDAEMFGKFKYVSIDKR